MIPEVYPCINNDTENQYKLLIKFSNSKYSRHHKGTSRWPNCCTRRHIPCLSSWPLHHPRCLKQQQQDPHLRSWQRTDRWSGCGPDLVIEFICSIICQLCALQLPLLFTQGPLCSQIEAATEEPYMVMSCLPANYRDFLGPGQRELLTMINRTAWQALLPLLPGPLPWLQKSRECCFGDDHQALTASSVWAGHLLLLNLGLPGQFQGTSYLPSSTNLETKKYWEWKVMETSMARWMGGRFGDGPWAGAPSAGFRMSPMDSVLRKKAWSPLSKLHVLCF